MANLLEDYQAHYSDMPFEQFAGKIHQKFYSDMPFEEFAMKAGIPQAQTAAEQTPNIAAKLDKGQMEAGPNPYTTGTAFAQGLTLDAQDEMAAGVAAPIAAIGNRIRGEGPTSLSENYQQSRAEFLRNKARFDEEHPNVATGAQVAGAVMSPGGGAAGKFITKAPTLLGKIARGAGVGAAYGGTQGALSGDGTQDRIEKGMQGAEVGAELGVAVPAAGALIGKGYNAITKGVGSPKAAQAAQDFESLGVPTTAGTVTQNKGAQILENALSNSPGGSQTIAKTVENQTAAFSRAKDKIVSGIGTPKSEQGAGEVIKDAAQAGKQRFETRQGKLYDDAFNKVGAQRAVQTPNVRNLVTQFESEMAAAQGSRDDVLGPVLAKAKLAMAAGDQGINFDAMRKLRTDIGRMVNAPMQGVSESARQDQLRALYGAISEDIKAAAAQAGPAAQHALALADRYTRFNLQVNQKLWKKMANLEADENAFTWAMQGSNRGGSRLEKLRRNFTSDEWDTVSASVFDRLGEVKPSSAGMGADFSVESFLTNWNKISDEAKMALFGSKRYDAVRPEIDKLVRTLGLAKATQRLGNPSGTARNMIAGGSMALAGSQAAMGNIPGAAATLFGTVVAPYVTARLMTSPAFIRAMTKLAASGAVGRTNVEKFAASLTPIAALEPDIRDDILTLQRQLGAVNQPANNKAAAYH